MTVVIPPVFHVTSRRGPGMDMTAFKTIALIAALSGILAGLVLTAVQQIQVIPLILKAEVYEKAADAALQADSTNTHAERDHNAWQPSNGLERQLFTAGANIVIALGFALLLGAATALRGDNLDWRTGILWGLGGFAVFFVAPSLGLPPEVPGTGAADLVARQSWWAATTILTAAGLSLIIFSRAWAFKILGAVLLVAPHLIGAPQPKVHNHVAPVDLAHAFVISTVVANAVFWLSLGGLFGFFHRKLTCTAAPVR